MTAVDRLRAPAIDDLPGFVSDARRKTSRRLRFADVQYDPEQVADYSPLPMLLRAELRAFDDQIPRRLLEHCYLGKNGAFRLTARSRRASRTSQNRPIAALSASRSSTWSPGVPVNGPLAHGKSIVASAARSSSSSVNGS